MGAVRSRMPFMCVVRAPGVAPLGSAAALVGAESGRVVAGARHAWEAKSFEELRLRRQVGTFSAV